MRLTTSDKIRTLQRRLYEKAKREPNFRFYLLYDKTWRADILSHAYDLARANGGAPGVDGVTFERIEAEGLETWAGAARRGVADEDVSTPQPVRRAMIPKPGGGERPPDFRRPHGSVANLRPAEWAGSSHAAAPRHCRGVRRTLI